MLIVDRGFSFQTFHTPQGDRAQVRARYSRAQTQAPIARSQKFEMEFYGRGAGIVLGVQALLLTGNTEANERLLPEVAEGTRTLAVCWAGAGGWDSFGVRAESGKLSGTAHYVLDGTYADTLLVVTSDGLFEVDGHAEGVTRTAVPPMDPTRRLTTTT